MPDRPNVLFVLSDQHNAKVLGHKGHPDVKTPNIDRLAAEGVRFDRAVTQNPICTPSRVSWLSGQYCHNHGYYSLSGPNPGGLPTVLGHFRRYGGYRTAAIGKIHCPEYWVEDDCDCFHEVCLCSIGGRSAEYQRYLDEREMKEDHGSLYEFGAAGRQRVDGRASFMKYEDSMESWSCRKAMEFMNESRAAGSPFFAHVSLPKPHQCYTPSEPFWSMYDESELTLPPNAEYDMALKAPHLRRAAEGWRKREWQVFEPKTFEAGRMRKLHGYLGNVSHVDHSVGELSAFLDEAGLAGNTIVIYSSDHGDYACEHGQMEKAPGICSDAITRVPFIWRLPGRFKEGHCCNEIVEAVDMANTVARLSGLPEMQTADGKDITHLLEGDEGHEGDEGAVHKIGVTEFAWSKSVYKGHHRLVYYPRELFAEEYP
ncbi:MAG: sulfatase family protein, partial [Planctomycetota bacterium]